MTRVARGEARRRSRNQIPPAKLEALHSFAEAGVPALRLVGFLRTVSTWSLILSIIPLLTHSCLVDWQAYNAAL